MQAAVLGELEQAFRRGSSERRVEILARIMDLFVAGANAYSPEQIELFGDVLARLVDEIETAARAELSQRLCRASIGPPQLLRRFVLDEATVVAQPLLSDFEALPTDLLVECAKTRGQGHLLAITKRKSIPEQVTDPIVERGDARVLQSVAQNPGSRFSNSGFGMLVDRAEGNDALAAAIGERPDLPRHHFLRLLTIASDIVRHRLQSSDPQDAGQIRKVVSQVAQSIAAQTSADSKDYRAAVKEVARLHEDGKLHDLQILHFAKEERFELVIAALAVLAKLEVFQVETIFTQERSDLLLILARALGLGWPTAKMLLQLRAGTIGLSRSEVERALASFERIDRATAEKVMTLKRRDRGH
uniref:DUF2336 domain-containing protein n=1 Tax=Rhodopseudomonas palustris (strain BisA53) TaxID=316055 RepID=Q07HD3_RHOP5